MEVIYSCIDLNLTPCELQTLCVWHCVLCCDNVATLAGATLLASLTSELVDSASLRYLRRRSLRELRCGGEKSFLLRQKKNTEHPNGYSTSSPLGAEGSFLFEPYSLRASNATRLALRALLRLRATLAEQSAPFALMSELLDANWLDYLRLRRSGSNPLFCYAKRKIRNTQTGIPYFWRSGGVKV